VQKEIEGKMGERRKKRWGSEGPVERKKKKDRDGKKWGAFLRAKSTRQKKKSNTQASTFNKDSPK